MQFGKICIDLASTKKVAILKAYIISDLNITENLVKYLRMTHHLLLKSVPVKKLFSNSTVRNPQSLLMKMDWLNLISEAILKSEAGWKILLPKIFQKVVGVYNLLKK